MKPAWYLISSDRTWKKWVNLLHWPYTLWFLAYIVLGASLAPDLNWSVLGLTLLAFFLGMGITAHAVDLLQGDPLRLGIPRIQLWVVAIAALILSVAIGIQQIITGAVPEATLVFIPIGILLALGYGLEWKGLHGDIQFALYWAVFPIIVSQVAQINRIEPTLIPMMIFGYLTARSQRSLSTRVRFLRRKVISASVRLEQVNAPSQKNLDWLISSDEQALAFLSFAIPIIAITLLVTTQTW